MTRVAHPTWQVSARAYDEVRETTLRLAAPLSAEDCCIQSMVDASPCKWHLAHTTWFFETFILEACEPGFRPFDAAFRVLFNSYYNTVGAKHPRPERGLLSRPPLAQVLAYRRDVDQRMHGLIEHGIDERIGELLTLGLHHEQQHQELILTDIKHLLSRNPLHPAYHERFPAVDGDAPALEWLEYEGGLIEIGHDGAGFAFDNESPRHKTFLQPYRLASRLVTNGEYAQFIAAGGYEDPGLWLSEGWDWVCANRLSAPLYWRRVDAGWREFTLAGEHSLAADLPAIHLSYFEADAYARWAGARLPSEAEWEGAADGAAKGAAGVRACAGNFADSGLFHPRAAHGEGLLQLYGDAWEWTQSVYSPYPGFAPAKGAVGEYNGKFMVNQYVLRGGSCATPQGHIRPSYRNFFPTSARWQFSGIRLARDAAAS